MSATLTTLNPDSYRPPTGMAAADIGQRFLQFGFAKECQGLLPLGYLQGAVEMQLAEILPIPQMAPSLLGIVSWRGKSTWIADLAQVSGQAYHSQLYPQSRKGMVLMVQWESLTLGLVVDRTISVVAHAPEQVLAVDDHLYGASLRALMSGYFLDATHQPWLLLDVAQVFRAVGL